MADAFRRLETVRIEDEVGRQLLLGHVRQVRRVGTVVTPDHEHQVRRSIQHFAQRILPLLRGTANGVEDTEVLVRPVARHHRLAQTPLHLLGLGTQHRGLVGHADFPQMKVGIETFRNRPLEFF